MKANISHTVNNRTSQLHAVRRAIGKVARINAGIMDSRKDNKTGYEDFILYIDTKERSQKTARRNAI